MKAVSNGDGVPHEVGGTNTEEEEAEEKVVEAAAEIHLQITWRMQEGEMDNRYPNWMAILAPQEQQFHRPCNHTSSHEQQTSPIYIRGTTTGTHVTHVVLCGGWTHINDVPISKSVSPNGFTRENAQQYIVAGHAPCIKGMHKLVLPTKRYT
jgi:hypothetical protein